MINAANFSTGFLDKKQAIEERRQAALDKWTTASAASLTL